MSETDDELLELCDTIIKTRAHLSDADDYFDVIVAKALKGRIERERWIPVGERMPENGDTMMVVIDCGSGPSISRAWHEGGGVWDHWDWHGPRRDVVTHWKRQPPLPSPPTAGGAN